MSLDSKLAGAQFAHEDVPFVINAKLKTELDKARTRVARLNRDIAIAEDAKPEESAGDTRLGSLSPLNKLRKELKVAQEDLDRIMRDVDASLIVVRIPGVSFGEWQLHKNRHPGRKGKEEEFNPVTMFIAYARKHGRYVEGDEVSEISPAQWDQIEASFNEGDHNRLAQAIFIVNVRDNSQGVDFLSGDSETTDDFSEISEPLED